MFNVDTEKSISDELIINPPSGDTLLRPNDNFATRIGDYLDTDTMKEYWDLLFGKDELDISENIRITKQLKPYTVNAQQMMDRNDPSAKSGVTIMDKHINSFKKLMDYWRPELYKDLNRGFIPGISISGAVFNYEIINGKSNTPGKQYLRKANNFVIDIDAHIDSPSRERYPFNILSDDLKNGAALLSYGELLKDTQLQGINIPLPKKVAATGGGLQLIFGYNKVADSKETDAIHSVIMDAVLRNDKVTKSERKKAEFKVLCVNDLNEEFKLLMEFDNTSKDPTHTQRLIGSRNNKYDLKTEFYDDTLFSSTENVDMYMKRYFKALLKIPKYKKSFTEYKLMKIINNLFTIIVNKANGILVFDGDKEITEYKIQRESRKLKAYLKIAVLPITPLAVDENITSEPLRMIRLYEYYLNKEITKLSGNPANVRSKKLTDTLVFPDSLYLNVKRYLDYINKSINEKIISNERSIEVEEIHRKSLIDSASSKTDREYEDLAKYRKPIISKIEWDDLVNFARENLHVHNEGKHNIYISNPFKADGEEDKNYSMAIYYNGGYPKIVDFLNENKHYDLVTFWQLKNKISSVEAFNQIISIFNLELDVRDQNNISKNITLDDVDQLITQVNTTDFIYYRNAQKRNTCIVRNKLNGESYAFDGPKMLSDHVLVYQLKAKNANKELREIFRYKFEEQILVDAFEEFIPGAEATLINSEFFKIVNMWVPGKNYENILLKAEEFRKDFLVEYMDKLPDGAKNTLPLEYALGVIKERTPFMYYYLHQITQKGNMNYFINWLGCVSQFKIMPVLPVFTSVQGSGKNLFVDEVLNYFLNGEYVNVINSDKIMNNFNSFMQTSSLIVLDEGDFSKSKDIDQLKMLTGNKTIQIEKKGVDSYKQNKTFNFIMLTNGEKPINHDYGDRRITYFRLDKDLVETINFLTKKEPELKNDIEIFIEKIRSEQETFWAIIRNIELHKPYINKNDKNNQYNKQIFLMHPVGELLIQMIEGKWDEISTQVTEKLDDPLMLDKNTKEVSLLKSSFEKSDIAKINILTINKYLKAKEFKSFKGVQDFIRINNMEQYGIMTGEEEEPWPAELAGVAHGPTVKNTLTVKYVYIDKEKIKPLISMKNNLEDILPEMFTEDGAKEAAALDKRKIKDVEATLMHADNMINDKDIEPMHDSHKPMHEIVKSNEEMMRLQNEMSINEMPPMLVQQEAPKVNYNNLNINRNVGSVGSMGIGAPDVTNAPSMPSFGNNNPIHTRQKL